jgi:hypothetical protein
MHSVHARFAIAASLLVACTSGPATSTPPAGPTPGTGNAAPEEEGGDGTETEPTEGKDGGTKAPKSTDLFPLTAGTTQHYTIARGERPGCDDGKMTMTTTGPKTDSEGATFYTRTASCGSYPSMDVKKEGNELWNRGTGTGAWYRFMVLPPEKGATFVAGGASGASFRWDPVATITVPAGTYTDCWRRSQVGYDVAEVYCPGVGMVSSDYDAWGQSEGYDLTSEGP